MPSVGMRFAPPAPSNCGGPPVAACGREAVRAACAVAPGTSVGWNPAAAACQGEDAARRTGGRATCAKGSRESELVAGSCASGACCCC